MANKNTSKKKRRRIVMASDIVPAGSTRESGNLPDEPTEAAVTIIPEGANEAELEGAAEEPTTAIDETTIAAADAERDGEEPTTAIDETTIAAADAEGRDGESEVSPDPTAREVAASEGASKRGKKKKRGKEARVEPRRDELGASDEDETDEILPEAVRGVPARSADGESADDQRLAEGADDESEKRAIDEIAPGPIDGDAGRELEGAASDDDDETTVPGAPDLADGAVASDALGAEANADEDEATEPAAHGDELWTPDESDQPAATVPAVDVSRAHLKGLIEALVFVSDQPLSINEIAKAAGKADRKLVRALADELRQEFARRGIHLDEVAGGLIFRTNPAYAPFIRDAAAKKPVKMTRAQLETLAIIAYRQPLTRPEVDEIRGVDSGPVMKMLLERDLVRILGKKDEPGRPLLYGTTNTFLEFFGLKALKDLPSLREFTELSDDSRKTFERELGDLPEGMEANAATLAAAASSAGPGEGAEKADTSIAPEAPTVVPGALFGDENMAETNAASESTALGAASDSDEESTTEADLETLAASDEDDAPNEDAREDAPETADTDELRALADEERPTSDEAMAEEDDQSDDEIAAESDDEVATVTDEKIVEEADDEGVETEASAREGDDEGVETEASTREGDEEGAGTEASAPESDEESAPESADEVATDSEEGSDGSDEDEISADAERASSTIEDSELEADSDGSNSDEPDAEV
jgi:segregation and condensation protein B